MINEEEAKKVDGFDFDDDEKASSKSSSGKSKKIRKHVISKLPLKFDNDDFLNEDEI